MPRRWIPTWQTIMGSLLFAALLGGFALAVQYLVTPNQHTPERVAKRGQGGRIAGGPRRGRIPSQRSVAIAGRVVDSSDPPMPHVADVTLAELGATVLPV